MSVAKRLFDGLVMGGESAIQQLIDEKQDEYQYLDFKQAETDSAPMKDNDRKTLGKAISGFANTDGGVIVWGVKCAKKNGVDIPTELKAISKIDAFKTDLERETPQAAEPYVMGIEHKMIPGRELGAGYIVTYVPEWDGLPVKSCVAKSANFYMRTGGRFSQMPYSFLADRFGRRPQPKLRLKAQLVRDPSSHSATLKFYVINEGRGLATKIAVVYDANVPMCFVDGWGYASGFAVSTTPFKAEPLCWEAPPEMVIYPESSRVCAQYFDNLTPSQLDAFRMAGNVTYQAFCEGYSFKGELEVRSIKDTNYEQILEMAEVHTANSSHGTHPYL